MSTFVIKGGNIYDPVRRQWKEGDLAVENGRITETILADNPVEIAAEGCIVTAGLIDYHVHYFNHGTENGCNPDVSSFPCGVTTVVDAGSCGAANYELYHKSVMAFSDVRIFNQLLMGSGGQATDRYPERLEEQYFDREKIRSLFRKYPDNLIGLKTRMSRGIIGEMEAERSLEETVALAEEIGCNVSVHITDPVMDLERLVSILREGDVVCHMYQGKGRETILDREGAVRKGIWKARERGVLFDASNGCNNFDLEICKKATEQGFTPDIISSDMNSSGYYLPPLHSLPRILSKYLELGMNLGDVLDRVTSVPAGLLGRKDLASLDVGTVADISIFQIRSAEVSYCDRAGHRMTGHQVLVPQLTMKDGKIVYCQADFM